VNALYDYSTPYTSTHWQVLPVSTGIIVVLVNTTTSSMHCEQFMVSKMATAMDALIS